MASINRPPGDITPKDFFETWLTAEYERLKAEGAIPASPPDGAVAVEVTGDAGGTWTLATSGGALSVSAGAGAADFSVSISVIDWREIIAGDRLPPKGRPGIEKLFIGGNPTQTQMLKSLKGTMIFQLSGLDGRTWSAKLTLGGAAQPEATISTDYDTFQQIRDKQIMAPQAYFAGKIQITGDAGFAMQAGMAMMSQG